MSGRINRFQPKTKEELKDAINLYLKNKEEAIKRYGIMNDWDVRSIKSSGINMFASCPMCMFGTRDPYLLCKS